MSTDTQEDTIDISHLPTPRALDLEIQDLQTRARRLKARLTQHTTNILSHSAFPTPAQSHPLREQRRNQEIHNQTILHRLTSSITTFPLTDPDPNAVNHRKLLALRFESFDPSYSRFQNPYYVFLNKPFKGADRERLRVHRHTLPPAINVAELAARWLSAPKAGIDGLKLRKQDLGSFAKGVRREIASFNYRLAIVKGLRSGTGLDGGTVKNQGVRDVSAIDAEGRQLRVEWDDGRVGRIVLGSKGDIERVVVVGESGRIGTMERSIAGDGDVVGLAGRL